MDTQKKLWHIAFSFEEPRPAVITLPGDTEDEAKKLLLDMAQNMRNVEIHECVDASILPNIQDMLRAQAEAKATEAVDVNPEKTKIN